MDGVRSFTDNASMSIGSTLSFGAVRSGWFNSG